MIIWAVLSISTDDSGNAVWYYDYDAFGNERAITGQDASLDANPFRYCGEYFDKETGTVYLRARYYDPVVGRMLSEDEVRARRMDVFDPYKNYQDVQLNGGVLQSQGQFIIDDPLSLNLYTYAYNNPIKFKDPSGNIAIVDDAAIILVLATGVVIVVTYEYLSSPEGQKVINDGATAIYNGAIIAGEAVTEAAEAVVDGIISGAQWVGEQAADAWTWTTGLFLAKNIYGDKTVEEVLKTKKGSIKNAPLPPGGPNWSDLLPLSMETIRKLAQKGETGYREIWKLLTDSRFNK